MLRSRFASPAFRMLSSSRAVAGKASPLVMVRRALATSATPNKGDLGADVLTLPDVPLASLQNKVVFVRCDFNVKYDKAPAGGFVVKPTSFKRIDESLPTLRHLIDTGARIVVASHLGDPTKEDLADPAARAKLSLAPVAAALETCLGHPVAFAADCVGPVAAAAVKALPSGGLLLLENLRFHAGEKKNDPAFVQSLVDTVQPAAYINDAFGTAHRKHASVVGVPAAISGPCAAGLLMAKEVKYLCAALPQRTPDATASSSEAGSDASAVADRPHAAAIVGGVKVDSKLPVFANLVKRVDRLLVGGAMALPFLVAQGKLPADAPVPAGVDGAAAASQAAEVLAQAAAENVEVVLPLDFATLKTCQDPAETGEEIVVRSVDEISTMTANKEPVFCMDVGPATLDAYAAAIAPCATVVWNGPLGKLEWKGLQRGTTTLAKLLSDMHDITTIAGGGETGMGIEMADREARAASADGAGVALTHVSTGGGASLEILKGEMLPALTALHRVA